MRLTPGNDMLDVGFIERPERFAGVGRVDTSEAISNSRFDGLRIAVFASVVRRRIALPVRQPCPAIPQATEPCGRKATSATVHKVINFMGQPITVPGRAAAHRPGATLA